ncbi:PhzF family phenazine biosynthesis protein [Paenibacillus pinistramenti]|uniref:PhzF family phenazine biosynthesis protein n=1 Tax=Paenibacillus pinistramenti TaxID=1768003 RepID=UPI001107AD7C|nr:PhzF family phenazine biosynthesis protein [Paenibacillus pinistramenti]
MELYIVDAFTSRPFGGNPAAVCICEQPLEAGMMQQIAQEMNLSETAFLTKIEDGYRLRWFTPAAEVKLCGHATLASAHILWETGRLGAGEEARFHTLSGILTARKNDGLVELDFPAYGPAEETSAVIRLKAAEALGLKEEQLTAVYRYGEDMLIELDSEDLVRSLTPDFKALQDIETRGISVTAAGKDAEFDCVSRFFCPSLGVNEDPVTGSAHCGIAPYWSTKLGKSKLKAYQASARGGMLELEMDGGRVKIAGPAVTVLKGKLDAPFLVSFS